VINRIAAKFTFVAATQDWHPPAHVSFASSHPGKKPYELMRIRGLEQVLWPDHCVQGSRGAEFHRELDVRNLLFIIRKGTNPKMDSYSTFLENDHRTSTGLSGFSGNWA